MIADNNHLVQLLRRRIAVLQEYAAELQRTVAASAELRVQQLQDSTAQEAVLAPELRFLDQEIRGLCRKLCASAGHGQFPIPPHEIERIFGKESVEKLRTLQAEESAARQQLRQQNRVRAAFLRRARRSVNVLMNLFAQFSETYAPPASARWNAAAERRT